MTLAEAQILANANLKAIALVCRLAFKRDSRVYWHDMLGEAYLQAVSRLRHYDASRSNVQTFLNLMVPELRRLAYGRRTSHAQKQRSREKSMPDTFVVPNPGGDVTGQEVELRDLVARVQRTLSVYRGGPMLEARAAGSTVDEIAVAHGISRARVVQLCDEAREACVGH